MDSNTLEFIKSNIPEPIDDNVIINKFNECNEDILETISCLLNIPKEEEKEETEWDKRRKIFDERDGLIQEQIKMNKMNNNNNN
jgi:hypothetical protein